jgi:phenylacetic acid degradation operon negative regulatory protein
VVPEACCTIDDMELMLQLLFVVDKLRMESAPVGALDPLSPRSIVLSVLLGSHPPRMPVRRLLEFTSLFGLADGAVRTALSRMVAGGDLVNDDGTYRLTARLVERQVQQDAGRRDPPADWDGTWWTVAVLRERRTMAERREFRARAVGSRLGELRPELWLRPANISVATDLADVFVTRGPIVAGDERQLVTRLWDVDAVQARAEIHRRQLAEANVRLAQTDDLALTDAFVALAAAQQFLRTEPQLPAELAPATATASAGVRSGYADAVTSFRERLAAFFARRDAAELSTGAVSTDAT